MAENPELFPRAVGSALTAALADTPVVCLLGPRQSGKTTLALTGAPDRVYISLDDQNYFLTATADPPGFVDGLPERVTLDEIQRVPALLPCIKRAVDRDRRPGRFLLTGSANLMLLPKVAESLAGRMEVITLQPLAEAEKERRPGGFLRELLEGRLTVEVQNSTREPARSLPSRLIAGGFPEPHTRSPERARQWHRQYLKAIIERDIRDVARIRNGDDVARLLELLALQTGGLLNTSGLAQNLGLHRETVESYLLLLERLFLIRRLGGWHSHPASRLVKAPRLHVADSGIAATLAGLDENDWLARRELMGHLFESFVAQQLMTQAAWTDPDLRFWHFRDKDKVEVDLVLTRGPAVWGVEVKAAAGLDGRDTRGLDRLAREAGKNFQGGVLIYTGADAIRVGNGHFLAVPVRKLWEL